MFSSRYFSISVYILVLSLSACGGESGNSTESGTENSGNSTLNKVSRYSLGEISDEDAGALARTLISTLGDFSATKDPTFNEDYNYISDNSQPTGSIPFTENCSQGGVVKGTYNVKSQFADANNPDIQVFTAGDSLTLNYQSCAGLLDNSNIFSGSSTLTVISGFHDFYDPYSDSWELKSVYDNHFINFDLIDSPNYRHGEITTRVTPESISNSGGFYAEKKALITNAGKTLVEQIAVTYEDYLFTTSKGDRYTTIGNGKIGSSFLGYSVEVKIDSPVSSHFRNINSLIRQILDGGSITATGNQGLMKLSFFEEYFNFQFDANNDGNYDSSGDIFWVDILLGA